MVVPDGVLSVLPGLGAITGKALVSDPRIKKVDLTGGTAGGRVIGKIVGEGLKSWTAELGGKAPIIVFRLSLLLVPVRICDIEYGSFSEDVDLDLAVNGVAFAR